MNKCHILLGRPWQHDVDATHQERENMYMFTWKGKRVAMRPISPTTRSTKMCPDAIKVIGTRGRVLLRRDGLM